ncbi:MAG: DUF4293 domain-containing protein [Edaphocola sp.]
MIQRIQSVWLLLAALAMAAVFYFDLYKFTGATSAPPLSIGENFLGIVLAALGIGLSLFAIFRFKNRKGQLGFVWLDILVALALQVWLFMDVNTKVNKPELANVPGHYWFGLFMPLIAVLLLFFARAGIAKDEKLVKSLDRLR